MKPLARPEPGPPSDAALRDADIVARLAQGQPQRAFETLLQRYQAKVFRLCFALLRDRHRAQDAAQDSFLRVWRSLDRYDPAKAALSTWIYAIARNRCLSLIDAAGPAPASLSEPAVWAQAQLRAAPARRDGEGQARLLQKLVEALPAPYRNSLQLFYFEERSVAQAAQMLGLPENTVKTHLHRARAALLQQLQALGLGEPGQWHSGDES